MYGHGFFALRHWLHQLLTQWDNSWQLLARSLAIGVSRANRAGWRICGVTSTPDKRRGRLSTPDNRPDQSGREDLNFRPLRPERSALAKLSYAPGDNQIRSTKYETRNKKAKRQETPKQDADRTG